MRAAARSGVDEASEALIEERTVSYCFRAHWARILRMRAGRSLLEEKDEVSKSITSWYWPWWKAVWMFTSSGRGQEVGLLN